MARTESTRASFNRGLISRLALARVDLKRSALSAETMVNWMSRTLGSMMLRPGWQYLGATNGNLAMRGIPFVRSLSSMSILEFTNLVMRVWTDDALLTRVAVTSAVTNGTFDANLAGWTDNDEAGAASTWAVGGYMQLVGTGTNAAIRDQQVTVAGANINVEHALRIVIQRGPVTLRVGSAAAGDQYITETTLYTGTHSLAFTPTGDFHIRFMSRLERLTLVDSCVVEGAGVVSITSPYAAANLQNIRADQDSLSVDVLFVACNGIQQRRIERRGIRSWSVVLYQADDGPFRLQNTSTQTMTPSVLTGNGTLTSSTPFFRSTHVGALFRVTSIGQTVTKSMTALNDSTTGIRITDVGAERAFTVVLSGLTGTGNTVVLQRSFDNSTWVSVSGKSWTADTNETYTDGLDNQIVYYRLRCTVYVAGTTVATLTIATGSITGVGRVTAFTSNLVVDIEVLTAFGGTSASDDWAEGQWSDFRGWPSAVSLYEGRLTWHGYDAIVASISDQFDGFDPDYEGDAGPINRTIGSGPMDVINWALPLQRLVLGAQMAEHSVRSNAFDEPLTPTNFNRKGASTQGSANVQAIKIDSKGYYVQRGGTRLMELTFDAQTYDYTSVDVCKIVPEVCEPSIVRIATQRQPDTRIHCVLSDGTVAIFVLDDAEEVKCWLKVDTDGTVEDVVVLPGASGVAEDRVYYCVARTINGATVRYFEKWALESECRGSTINKQMDAFAVGVGGSYVVSLPHLIGETVVAWANGKDLGTYVVDGAGNITLSELPNASGSIAGLGYTARFKSAKLGQTLSKHKHIDTIAPILIDTHAQGLEMGPDFTTMDNLPLMYQGSAVDTNRVYTEYDEDSQTFPGTWSVDARVCLRATAPRPCTIAAMTISGQVT